MNVCNEEKLIKSGFVPPLYSFGCSFRLTDEEGCCLYSRSALVSSGPRSGNLPQCQSGSKLCHHTGSKNLGFLPVFRIRIRKFLGLPDPDPSFFL